MQGLVEVVGAVVLFLGAVALFVVLTALPTMILWNWLMPEIFGLTTITFWQALGLIALSSFLFKDFGKNNSD